MKVFLAVVSLMVLMQTDATGKRHKMRTHVRNVQGDDPLLEVEPIPPDTMIGQCSCQCCENAPEPLVAPKCANDIIVAVDSSACFRDHHSKMMRFLRRLVRKIGRTPNIQYGGDETRLGLMQFSSDILFPLHLSSFEDYTNPSTRKGLMNGIDEAISSLGFLGEGSFLNKALNATVSHFQNEPRPQALLDQISPTTPRPVVILMTNGKSHPSVTMDDIELSIAGLQAAGVTVIPISVTRECHGVQNEVWNEGLCPDTIILNKLAKVGRGDSSTFMEMKSHDALPDLIQELEECYGSSPESLVAKPCNNCTCSCELPIGPQGPEGKQGQKGQAIKGEQGPKGEIGPPGVDGLDGDKGNQGDKGDTGEKGDIGPQGEVGEVGPKGDKGIVGDKGEVGEKGVIGITGPKGNQGIKGSVGDKGEVGEKGTLGQKGEIGEDGLDGAKGTKGEIGAKGEKGVGEKGTKGGVGDVGPKGDLGAKGVTGDKGGKGMVGLCGKPGPAGKTGVEGIAGIDGLDGSPGQPGLQGPRGPRGDNGDKGEPGPAGVNGFAGARGLPGLRGPQGVAGTPGERGEKGEPSTELGLPGVPGISGPKGEPGQDGADGLDGVQGVRGNSGPRGEPGPRGHPGSYDLDELRGIISEIVRDLLPGDCTAPDKIIACHEYPIDITFLVDGSDSIDREEFDRVKEWILLTVDAFNPSERKQPLHVDVVQYSERSMIEVDSDVTSSSQIAQQVRDIVQMRSGTKTYSGLEFVNQQVWPLLREGAFKILITMTDGDASEDRNLAAISDAHNKYDYMAAVGVGSKVISTELDDFSSTGNVFNVDNFAALESIISRIVENICAGIADIGAGEEPAPPEVTTVVAPRTTTVAPPPTTTIGAPAPIGCSNAMTDLAFVLDGSASVGEDGFVLLREFLVNLVSGFTNVGRNGVQVAMIQYNDNPRMEFQFHETGDNLTVLQAIDTLEYMGGNTNTGLALTFLQQAYINRENPRPTADKVAVIITDGRSQDDVIVPALLLKQEDVAIFAIGVGEAERIELEEMASDPISEFVFTVDDYSAIATIQEKLLKKICGVTRGVFRSAPGETSPEDEKLIPVLDGSESGTSDEDYFGSGELFYVDENP